jgi:hypothetical protein
VLFLLGFLPVVLAILLPFVLYAWKTHRKLGQPITVDKLKKRCSYTIIAAPVVAGWHGTSSLVLVRDYSEDKIVAVELPVSLPEGVTGFCVVPNYDEMGNHVEGTLALLAYLPDQQVRIVVPLKPPKPPKDE